VRIRVTASRRSVRSEKQHGAALAPEVLDYLKGGSGEEHTLADNEEAFIRWRFRPRVMSGAEVTSLSCTIVPTRCAREPHSPRRIGTAAA
jgi:isopentenyl diphosphate isomerase/L-lactate dehydrogenase-like FMN-dependent dehydrogenase